MAVIDVLLLVVLPTVVYSESKTMSITPDGKEYETANVVLASGEDRVNISETLSLIVAIGGYVDTVLHKTITLNITAPNGIVPLYDAHVFNMTKELEKEIMVTFTSDVPPSLQRIPVDIIISVSVLKHSASITVQLTDDRDEQTPSERHSQTSSQPPSSQAPSQPPSSQTLSQASSKPPSSQAPSQALSQPPSSQVSSQASSQPPSSQPPSSQPPSQPPSQASSQGPSQASSQGPSSSDSSSEGSFQPADVGDNTLFYNGLVVFIAGLVLCVAVYLAYHNKDKIMDLLGWKKESVVKMAMRSRTKKNRGYQKLPTSIHDTVTHKDYIAV